jgi:hypothetical protein
MHIAFEIPPIKFLKLAVAMQSFPMNAFLSDLSTHGALQSNDQVKPVVMGTSEKKRNHNPSARWESRNTRRLKLQLFELTFLFYVKS